MNTPQSANYLGIGALLLAISGCSGSSGGPTDTSDVGGTATGGTVNGGANTGGVNTGGNATGGKATGGNTTGGTVNGGASTGGVNTGGTATGGNATGGKATGGNSIGGNATGGTVNGGASTGGVNTGGNAIGGNTTGGKATGGNTIGGNATGGTVNGGASTGGVNTGGNATGGASNGTGGGAGIVLPTANASFDYQIGGAYTPPTGVRVVSRDRNSAPAAGLYNICYVNGFQIQPDEESFWTGQHPTLVLRDSSGNPVVDEGWGEMLLDTSTAAKRSELATIIGGWIAKCKSDGFNAVEVDNLDSYSRSGGLLTQANNVAFMALLSSTAHGNGLAIAQKNSSELLGSVATMGTDFAVVEECNRYDECDTYQTAYGNLVYIIEYRSQDFQTGCSTYPELSIVLRDLNVSTPSSSAYVYQGC